MAARNDPPPAVKRNASPPPGPPRVRTSVFRLLRYLKPYWREQGACLGFLLVGSSASLAIPLLLRHILDDAIPTRDVGLLARIALAMAAVHLLYVLFMFLTDVFFLRVSTSIVRDLRAQMFRHLMNLSLGFLGGTKAGQVQARVMGDVDAVQVFATNALLMTATDLLTLLLMLGLMVHLSPALTTAGLGALILLVVVFRFCNRRQLRLARTARQEYGRIAEDLQEGIAGVREIKAFSGEGIRSRAFTARLQQFARAGIRMGLCGSMSNQISFLLVALAPVAVYLYGGFRTIEGTLSLGTLIAFTAYLTRMYEPVERLAFMNVHVHTAMGAVERIFEFLDTEPTTNGSDRESDLPQNWEEITLHDVSFSYGSNGSPPALSHVNLRVRRGEHVAVVGPSGSGKTTLASLLCRFRDPTEGRVAIGGRDVRTLRLKDLRRFVAIVPQETYLFHASIAENLRLAKPDATLEELRQAARLARADDFITALPAGYETVVGERGTCLSGGQRQRLAIARALLRDPELAIFDEATCSLDLESERQVKASLDTLMSGRTTIVISHRLSTVADADRIIVLDGGRVVEEGTHRTLMATNRVYRRLYERNVRRQPCRTPVPLEGVRASWDNSFRLNPLTLG
jgi:ATP-binding cassette subfamily B protein